MNQIKAKSHKFFMFIQDVISGYVSNSHFVRDLYPPGLLPGQESPLYGPTGCNTYNPNSSRQSSMLNVSDPRFSATYGNPYLRQVCQIYLFWLLTNTLKWPLTKITLGLIRI